MSQNKQPLTHHQQQIVNQSKYTGIALGVLSSILVRAYGLSNVWVWLLIISLACLVIAWAIYQLNSPCALPRLQSSQNPDLKRQLVRMCGGDVAQADRLIAFEKGDCRAAIERLMRDRR